eukprot:COSAG01_NODE_43632_length_427_cov_23.076220_1_plen_26_part_01
MSKEFTTLPGNQLGNRTHVDWSATFG